MVQRRPDCTAEGSPVSNSEGPRDLPQGALDLAAGGVNLQGPSGVGLEFDGSGIEQGIGRVFNDAYQYYFPNAASNRVAEALQERQIRDAQGDLQIQPLESYTPPFPYDGPSSFDAAPQTGPTTYGYEDFAGGYTGGDLYGVVGE